MTVKTNIHYDQNMEPMITETRGEVAHVEKPTITSAEKRELLSIVPNVAKSGDGRVTIIILAWNQLRYTKICIESIKRLTDRNRYDLVLVDNGSTDKTIEYLKTVLDGNRDIVISNATNRGFSGGNNQGLKVAESEYILMLNNDCRIEKDNWLDILFYESEGKNIGLVGALCHKAAPDYARKMFDHIGAGRESDKWSYIEGWCIFGKRELFVKLDGFDMRFNPAYGEDADLSYRVKELGLKIKAVKLPIKHFGNKSKSQLDRSIPHQSDKSGRRMFSKWINNEVINKMDGKEKIKTKEIENRIKHKPTILFIRKGARGDVLLTTPILKELKKKYPNSLLVYETECPDILVGNPHIDRIERFVPDAKDYDIVLTPRYEVAMSENAIDTMAKQCDVELSEKKLEIALSESHTDWAKNKINGHKRTIAFHTGRAWASKEWRFDNFMDVIRYYSDKGYGIIEVGNKQTQFSGIGVSCRGCSIKQTAALIKECCIFVGIDSGCAHLAKAVGTPACVIYGCVHPKSPASDAVEYPIRVEGLECGGCRGRTSAEWTDCIKPEVYCLTGISPEMVIKTINKCIKRELNT
ncbi:glycosyltransferase [Candidatus Pacearchaeota archaeon]|nr:glycosyltransferase [Candidatus Pacearchaeota archaeon]